MPGIMEKDPLLVTYHVAEPSDVVETNQKTSNRLTIVGRVAGVVLLGALVTAGVSHFTTSSSSSKEVTASSLSSPSEVQKVGPITDTGYYFYKSAFLVANGSSTEAWEFLDKYSGGYACEQVTLGCDGVKLTCDYGVEGYVMDKQLHYVEMPKVFSHAVDGDELGADGWNQIQKNNLAGLAQNLFSTQVHNKIELVVGDVIAKITQLESAGYRGMRRYGLNKNNVPVGHYLVPVEGTVWDFVSTLPTIDKAHEYSFQAWADDECAVSHDIGSDVRYLSELTLENNFPEGSTWTGTQIAVSDMDSDAVKLALRTLVENTGAVVKHIDNDNCRVAQVTYNNVEETGTGGEYARVELKFVQNNNYQQLAGASDKHPNGLFLSDYENYVGRVHERYLSRPADGTEDGRWRGWDHFLDQHIGIKYAPSDGCENQAQKVNKMLLDNKIPVGKRSIEGDGDHYYAGFPSVAMTLEFNTECHYGEGNTNICACMHANSDVLFLEKYDYSCVTDDDQF